MRQKRDNEKKKKRFLAGNATSYGMTVPYLVPDECVSSLGGAARGGGSNGGTDRKRPTRNADEEQRSILQTMTRSHRQYDHDGCDQEWLSYRVTRQNLQQIGRLRRLLMVKEGQQSRGNSCAP